jgi:hypothetical protein
MTYCHHYGKPCEEEITQITTYACIYLDDNEHILRNFCMHGFVHLGTQDLLLSWTVNG